MDRGQRARPAWFLTLVPDYLTNVPFGSNYGWPWAYWKKNIDWRVKEPMPEYLMDYVRKPEYGLGAHVAPLGLAFARGGNLLGDKFQQGAFIARHGSWNRRPLSGYDVVFVKFDALGNVLPKSPVPVLTGFLTEDQKARGRPTWVAFAKGRRLARQRRYGRCNLAHHGPGRETRRRGEAAAEACRTSCSRKAPGSSS